MSSDSTGMPRWILVVLTLASLALTDYRDSSAAEAKEEYLNLFLGRVERKKELGLLADAKQLLEERLTANLRSGGSDATRHALQASLADVHFRARQYGAAIRLAHDSLHGLTSETVVSSGQLRLRVTQLLARAYVARDRQADAPFTETDRQRAERLLEEALVDARKTANPLLPLEVMALRAELTERLAPTEGDRSQARERWQELERELDKVVSDYHTKTMPHGLSEPICRFRVQCRAATGDYKEAVRLLETLLGRPDVTVLERRQLLVKIADVCRLAGQYDDEAGAWDRVLQLQEESGTDELAGDVLERVRLMIGRADCRLRWLDAHCGAVRDKGAFDPTSGLTECKALYLEASGQLNTVGNVRGNRDASRAQRRRCLRGLFDVFERGALWSVLSKVDNDADRLRYTLDLLEELKAALPEGSPELYAMKLSVASQYVEAGDYGKAEPYLIDVERFYRSYEPLNGVALARSLNLLSEVDRTSGRLPQADNRLAEAAAIAEHHESARSQLSLTIVVNRGRLAAALGRYNDAQGFFVDAVRRAEQIGLEAADSQSLALLNLGLMYKALTRCEEAETYCQDALELRRKSLAAHESEAKLLPYYAALGGLAIVRRDPTELAKNVQEARRISTEYGKDSTYLGTQVCHQEAMLHYLNYCRERRQAEADAARQLWRKVHQVAAQRGWTTDESAALYYLSRLHFLAWQTPRVELQSAIAGAKKKYTDKRQEYMEETAIYEGQVKAIAKEAGKFNSQVARYETFRNRAGSQETHDNLVVRRADLEEKKTQLNARHESLKAMRAAVSLAYERYAAQRQRKLLPEGLDEAERLAAQAVIVLEQAPLYPSLHYVILCHHAEVLRSQAWVSEASNDEEAAAGLRRQAISRLDEAIGLIEQPRLSTFGGDVARAEFFARYATAFDLMISVLFEDNPREHAKKALAYAERRRNRTFLDRVHADGVNVRQDAVDVDGSIAKREQQLLAEWAVTTEKLRHLSGESQLAEEQLNQWERLRLDLDRITREYEAVRQEVLARSPMYSRVLGAPLTEKKVEAAVEQWLDSNEPALYYYVGENESYLFLIGILPGQVEIRRISTAPDMSAVSADRIATWVHGYVAMIKGEIESSGSTFADRARLGMQQWTRMTESLVPRDVRQRIRDLPHKRVSHLNVFPDGKLYQLPFEALLVELGQRPQFLMDTIQPSALCYGPSLMITQRLKARAQRETDGAIRAVSVADPAVENISPLTSPVASRYLGILNRTTLEKLEKSADEAKGFAQAWGKENVTSLLGDEATEGNLRAELNDSVTCLHLATHGITAAAGSASEATEDGSSLKGILNSPGALVLASPEGKTIDRSNDAFLELDEIYGLRIRGCELAVLSACNTNIGPSVPLEIGTAMSRAFLSAGARRVVSSQWSVDSISTSRLMKHFFEQVAHSVRMGRSPDYAMALQNARRALREDDTYQDPFYWAPFILTGPAN